MPLIEDVKRVCDRLAPLGWRDLLLAHGLDITATNLKQELTKELPNINRNISGFEDFAGEGKRGIEAGNPARSLLFHAFASPNVVLNAQSTNSQAYPTLAELEIIENFVYGVQPPSWEDLQVRAQGQLLAIVVFASEYRPGAETVQRKHADMCFSRTGVARVGTAEPLYDARLRGFLPFVEGDIHAFRVLPARYSAYVAVQRKGNRSIFGPMRFQPGDSSQPGDNSREFWVPLHKLFNGRECIRGLNLQVTLATGHVNEKLRRIHLELRKTGWNTGWSEPDLSNPPFIFTQGIAEFTTKPDFGSGLLVPVVHSNLVEAATYKGKVLTFRVPQDNREEQGERLSSSLRIPLNGPEYVHVRHKVLANGEVESLNNQKDVEGAVQKGGYDAVHYLDFTGDGWVEAVCPELAVAIPRRVPAYSLVTAPDFFPNCDQRELLEWTEQSVPQRLRENLWRIPPETLSDDRIAPNLQLKGANFRPEDKTVTAIVSLPFKGTVRQMPLNGSPTMRHAYLPDAAAGLFAPGWDIGTVVSESGEEHLATYRLGSPFPEDSKLCAALSTFWPAVAPDAARTFQPNPAWPTVSPLTDEEIGQTGNLPWDGIPGPRRVTQNGKNLIEYADLAHADYVESSLQKKFSLSLTGRVDVREYEARVLAMAKVYEVLNITPDQRGQWSVFSFRQVQPTDSELKQAQTQTGTTVVGSIYRFEIYRYGNSSPNPDDFRKQWVEIQETVTLFVTPLNVLLKRNNDAWRRA
ncbi:hypothetical protein SAMD00079811_71410 [Scytonema sp. HK-05]|uniref:hypothetical protein n=1 Tax=Scytonema sp. HK-05 TaxID=1137095 RepID=UPI000937DC69|nr:hypothetical protein [Scytonema sp. HK-05]OKH56992.1 hypothetical protein NIES2130_22045 [Scytonema sp. HK-05]BAY49512.1 hypothetical protein SAMD00079811_71410 [Scytonema sp. HK-05]